ncbi:MAG TPA: prolipoprotein diacylglyceryl transferase family protein [Candidatus Limnocylindrales bacterium]|nr:prolipoprotein diacylglyceryl transferase family protein [Candidatus Limnocylindrales bacterium]
MQPAALTLAFGPILPLGPLGPTASVRLETLGIALALLVAILLAAWIGRRTPAIGPYVPAPGLRPDDLVFLLIGAVPGAVLGGRLGYVLDHLEFYRSNPGLIADFSQGGLALTLAVPLGIASAAAIGRLIGAPLTRWLHATAVPLLVALALGKLAGVLGATGQGLPGDLPWATAYAGPGPWGSLAPDIAANPSQVYEAILVGLAIVGLFVAARSEVVARRDGGAMFVALALWAMARFVVAFTWRDPVAIGPLRVDQVLSLLLLALAVLGVVERWRASSLAPGWGDPAAGVEPAE